MNLIKNESDRANLLTKFILKIIDGEDPKHVFRAMVASLHCIYINAVDEPIEDFAEKIMKNIILYDEVFNDMKKLIN